MSDPYVLCSCGVFFVRASEEVCVSCARKAYKTLKVVDASFRDYSKHVGFVLEGLGMGLELDGVQLRIGQASVALSEWRRTHG